MNKIFFYAHTLSALGLGKYMKFPRIKVSIKTSAKPGDLTCGGSYLSSLILFQEALERYLLHNLPPEQLFRLITPTIWTTRRSCNFSESNQVPKSDRWSSRFLRVVPVWGKISHWRKLQVFFFSFFNWGVCACVCICLWTRWFGWGWNSLLWWFSDHLPPVSSLLDGNVI